ncbi:MAG: RNA polymerase sigma factor [Bryobacterales bacterium]|nr:RNA polymerase sigma factor [Bryobacterales bacterium]
MGAVAAARDDSELMLRVKAGDKASFDLLLDRYRAPVVGFLYRMVQNQAVAEDLAQEVFLRVYRARAGYEPVARFTTWLFRIATRVALTWLRDGRREQGQESVDDEHAGAAVREIADGRPSVEQTLVCEARLEEVRRAILALPGKQRAAVLMHKYEEMEYSQIARVLECSESAVKSLLFRAYENLRARLAHMA